MIRIAFLGTGLLGSGMVEAMRRRGLSVTVWNRTASKARALEALLHRMLPASSRDSGWAA
jgi:3-hydroxyisobutyrate dehydrogenase